MKKYLKYSISEFDAQPMMEYDFFRMHEGYEKFIGRSEDIPGALITFKDGMQTFWDKEYLDKFIEFNEENKHVVLDKIMKDVINNLKQTI